MKRKIKLSILVILLIATCTYAAWESGLLLQGIKGILVQQLSKMMQAKVSIARMDMYDDFIIVRELDIKHRDYDFSSPELIIEYDPWKILTHKFDVIGGIRQVTLVCPKISIREMSRAEVEFLVFPYWAKFFKFASHTQGASACFTRGRCELGSMSMKGIYFNADLSKKEENCIPVKFAMRGLFSAPKIEIPFKVKSELKVAAREMLLKGNFSIGDLPYAGVGIMEGAISDPDNPKMFFDLTLSSKKLKFRDVFFDAPIIIASMKGESGVFQTEGKFNAVKGSICGREVTGLSFVFRKGINSYEVKGNADFTQGRLILTKGICRKEKKLVFEGDASLFFKGYEVPMSFLYKGGDLDIKKISFEQGGEILLDGGGTGKLTKRKLSLFFKFKKGRYAENSRIAGISLVLDFPFAENLEKKLDILFGKESKIEVGFRVDKNGSPCEFKTIFSEIPVMALDQELCL